MTVVLGSEYYSMLLAKSGGAADPKKIRIFEAEYRAEKGFSRPPAGFANSIITRAKTLLRDYGGCETIGAAVLRAGLTRKT